VKQKSNKYLCALCQSDTKLINFSVRSSVYKKIFCDMECFNNFIKQKEKENKDELPTNI